jgi:hypothetical protein
MDNTHGFERAGILRFVPCICEAQLEEEHMTCMTSHAISRVLQPKFASPVAKLCTSHRDASSRTRPHLEDRDNSTWQLLSEGATPSRVATAPSSLLLVGDRVSTRPQQVEKRIRESSREKSNFDLPAAQREDPKLFEHGAHPPSWRR